MNVLFLNAPGFDYLGSQLNEGFHLLHKDGKINYRAVEKSDHHGAMVSDLETCSIEDALGSLGWADIILFNFGDPSQMDSRLMEVFFDNDYRNKKVFIDVYDRDDFLVDPRKVAVYFNREMRYPACTAYCLTNVRSLVFGVYQNLIDALQWHDPDEDWDNRDIDVSFMAFGGSNAMRQQIGPMLEKIASDKGWTLECHVQNDGQPVSPDKYHEILYRSKIGISLPGAGYDTHRFWDIPGHGAVLCSFDLTTCLQMRHGFESHRHCLYFTNYQSLAEQCHNVVSDKQRWVQMRRATDYHLRFHTTRSRAVEVLQIFSEMSSQKIFENSCTT